MIVNGYDHRIYIHLQLELHPQVCLTKYGGCMKNGVYRYTTSPTFAILIGKILMIHMDWEYLFSDNPISYPGGFGVVNNPLTNHCQQTKAKNLRPHPPRKNWISWIDSSSDSFLILEKKTLIHVDISTWTVVDHENDHPTSKPSCFISDFFLCFLISSGLFCWIVP